MRSITVFCEGKYVAVKTKGHQEDPDTIALLMSSDEAQRLADALRRGIECSKALRGSYQETIESPCT
jgi:hypothetical protein